MNGPTDKKDNNWPPRFTYLPEGVAALYLTTFGRDGDKEAIDKLVGIFKLYYESGYEADKQASEGWIPLRNK